MQRPITLSLPVALPSFLVTKKHAPTKRRVYKEKRKKKPRKVSWHCLKYTIVSIQTQ